MILPQISDHRDNNGKIVPNHEALLPSGQRLTLSLSVWMSKAPAATVSLNDLDGFPLKSHLESSLSISLRVFRWLKKMGIVYFRSPLPE
jgi:hypothetical protein